MMWIQSEPLVWERVSLRASIAKNVNVLEWKHWQKVDLSWTNTACDGIRVTNSTEYPILMLVSYSYAHCIQDKSWLTFTGWLALELIKVHWLWIPIGFNQKIFTSLTTFSSLFFCAKNNNKETKTINQKKWIAPLRSSIGIEIGAIICQFIHVFFHIQLYTIMMLKLFSSISLERCFKFVAKCTTRSNV